MKSRAGSCSRSSGGMIQVEAGCCCRRFIPGDDSGVQHSPGWADGGRQLRQRGSRVPAKTLLEKSAGALFIALKGKNVAMDTKLTLNPPGEGGKRKEWALLPSITIYVLSKDDTNLKSKA